ncbi:hypothetical protein [Hyphomonas sp.]|uniref:hypothetical protein n=1 Tax=Hyphomonas sp. TaxID=87 RepID=UPI0025B7FC57|nr:hypothetical protein [Hyphomonas sp.]
MYHGVPSDLTVWELANSQAAGTLITAIATIVAALIARQIVKRVDEVTDQQRKKAVDEQLSKRHELQVDLPTQQEIDTAVEQPNANLRPFSRASAGFGEIRAAVDKLVSNVSDGRRRRKYKGLPKTDLRVHVYHLWQDDSLGLPVAELVDDAISQFYSYRTRPDQMPLEVVEQIERAATIIKESANA